ncbi:hypothetical protein [Pantoea dispersa]|uniref:hypothetical protein n=1 Tax=Pantoea dispersa TaxID=59814 RepID=UPI001CA6CD91|nr:hypothetical protein [Pantoea dispersa]QZY97062.1 hypothetical protein K7X52_22150 [Pantoea dispersa]
MVNGIGPGSFSPLHLSSASARVTSSTASNATRQNSLTADASAKVTFSEATDTISAVYQMTPARVTASTPLSPDMQTQAMGALRSSGVSMNGIGSALLSALTQQRDDVTISVPASGGAQTDTQSAVALEITTQSGVSLTLQMTRQQDGVAVALKTTHGKLSDDEAAAIAKLSGALEKTLSGLDNGNGKLDVGDLLSFDSNQLASVDLKTDLRRSGEVMQSLNLHADPGSRWLGFHNADASFKLTTDMRSLAQASNAGQQQSALAQWSAKFDQAASRGHGDRAALALFKQGFESLNSTSAAAGLAMRTPQAITVGAHAAQAGAISGLADFSASYHQTARSSNPLKPEEEDTFALDVAQRSSQQKNGDTQRMTQETLFKLNASFHTALSASSPLALNETKESQNYHYHQIHDETRSTTEVTQDAQGNLTARFARQLTQQETVKTYQLAKLIDSTSTPHSEKTESTRHYSPAMYLAQA